MYKIHEFVFLIFQFFFYSNLQLDQLMLEQNLADIREELKKDVYFDILSSSVFN